MQSKFFFIPFILILSLTGMGQNQCPPNIDFEMGSFTNWVCRSGNASYSAGQCIDGGYNTFNLGSVGQIAGRHTIIPSSNLSLDFYGHFPVSCPNGSGYSVKLGDNTTGSPKAQGITYTYSIPATSTNFSIVYQYAVVLQDPSATTCPAKHAEGEKPRFQARIKSISTGLDIGCVSFDFFAGGTLPGFLPSPNSPSGSVVYYKDWTPVTLNLGAYAGQDIQIEFITSNCTRGGHFGYAYVDINSNCNGSIVGTTICTGDTVVSLTAPYGFQAYAWYSDMTFSQVIGTNQILVLSPAPNVGAVYPVIVTPFPGYGCVDTLYATLSLAAKPPSDAGPDKLLCKWEQAQLGTPLSNPNYTYLWTPSTSLSDPTVSNPTVMLSNYIPQTYIVTTKDQASGCAALDTVVVTPKNVDTTLTIMGKVDFCASDPINTSFHIVNSSTSIQWFNNATPIAGANGTTYNPTVSGLYWASFMQNTCVDSTRQQSVMVRPVPIAGYSVSSDSGCITNNSFIFTDTSSISDATPLSYLWSFGDGNNSGVNSPVKSYTTTGVFTVKLVVNSQYGCMDSTYKTVHVLPNVNANFIWDSICTFRPVLFTNLTKENGSPSVTYAWDFSQGIFSGLKNPAPVLYTLDGLMDVKLSATALGCESDPQKITKTAWVHIAKPGIRYPDKLIPVGYSTMIYARDSVGKIYNWIPSFQLSASTIKAPFFYGNSDQLYQVFITNQYSCLTIDTMQVYVLKKKGWYLPNAFTPNGDGLNDIVRPYLIGMKGLRRFSIYNRNGERIFSSTRDGDGWDGTYKGNKQDAGAFVWILEYVDTDDKLITQKGSLLLIR